MPVWHEATAQWVQQGKLSLLGVTQEQHADRGQLFAQWKRFEWPILNDPINLLRSKAVPILVAIDEHGIVRQIGPKLDRFEAEFINKTFLDDAPALHAVSEPVAVVELRRRAEAGNSGAAWMRFGDALALWGGASALDDAIDAYQRAGRLEPGNGMAHFRLGVCYRRRFESEHRRTGDFQSAAEAWGTALAIDPNQYIWRRRIQQYGPRLDKPYSFYDWVSQAVADITARGERPIELAVAPRGAELAAPIRSFVDDLEGRELDPDGKIHRDDKGLIETEIAVVPARPVPGRSVQIHINLRPAHKQVHWNNESEPLHLFVQAPDGWKVSRRLVSAPPGKGAESRETRSIDFELTIPASARGTNRIKCYALYYVCELAGGQCLYLRKDIEIPVDVGRHELQ